MNEHSRVIYKWAPFLHRIFFLCHCGRPMNFPDFGSAYEVCVCTRGWEFNVETGQIIGYWYFKDIGNGN